MVNGFIEHYDLSAEKKVSDIIRAYKILNANVCYVAKLFRFCDNAPKC